MVGILLEGQIDVEADGFASGLVGTEVGGFHDAGTTAGGDDEAVAAGGNLNGPLGKKKSQASRVLVVAGHVDGGAGALEAVLMLRGVRCVFFHGREIALGRIASLEAGGAEKDDGVLNLLAAKARERFLVLCEDAKNASVGTVDEGLILVGQRGGFKFIDHVGDSVLRSGIHTFLYSWKH